MLTGQTLTCDYDFSGSTGTFTLTLNTASGDPCVYELTAENTGIAAFNSGFFAITNGTCTTCPSINSFNSPQTWIITGAAGQPCGSTTIALADFLANGLGCPAAAMAVTLPVELTSFRAMPTAVDVQLVWQTASEENNSGFEIQRSSDAQHWEKLGFVKGHGTTIAAQNYKWLDKAPLPGTSYYQLKQIDSDGTSEYSEVVVVETKLKKDDLLVFPNPATDEVRYQIAELAAVRAVELYDVYGKLLKSAPSINGTLSLTDVTAGLYLLVVETQTQRLQQMVVKQ